MNILTCKIHTFFNNEVQNCVLITILLSFSESISLSLSLPPSIFISLSLSPPLYLSLSLCTWYTDPWYWQGMAGRSSHMAQHFPGGLTNLCCLLQTTAGQPIT